jgi:hypothetical protein
MHYEPSCPLEESRWVDVEHELGFTLSGERLHAHRVVQKLRTLNPIEKAQFEEQIASDQGSAQLLYRLEQCIQSQKFQDKIMRKIQQHGTALELEEQEVELEAMDNGFVLVGHLDVVDALAEYLVLTYMEKYHFEQIEQIRKQNSGTEKIKSLLVGIGKTLGDLAKSKALETAWKWGLSTATSSLGFAVLAYASPQMAIAALNILWQILKFSFRLLV